MKVFWVGPDRPTRCVCLISSADSMCLCLWASVSLTHLHSNTTRVCKCVCVSAFSRRAWKGVCTRRLCESDLWVFTWGVVSSHAVYTATSQEAHTHTHSNRTKLNKRQRGGVKAWNLLNEPKEKQRSEKKRTIVLSWLFGCYQCLRLELSQDWDITQTLRFYTHTHTHSHQCYFNFTHSTTLL